MNKLRMKKTTKITLRIQPFIMNQHSKKLSIKNCYNCCNFCCWAPVPGYNIAVISVLVFQSSPLNTWQFVMWHRGTTQKPCQTCPQHVPPCRAVPGEFPTVGRDVVSEWGDIVASPDTKPWNRSVASEDLVYCGWFRLLGCCFLQKLRSEPPWR